MKRTKRLLSVLTAVLLIAALMMGLALSALAADDSAYELEISEDPGNETEIAEIEEDPAGETVEEVPEEVPAEETVEEVPEEAPTEDDPGEEVPDTPYVIDHVTWQGSTLTFEDPEYMPEAVYTVNFVYSFLSVNDLTTLRYLEGEVYPDFNDGVWHYDFDQVVNRLPDLTMGKLSYFISVFDTDPKTKHRSNANAFQGEITVHIVMDPIWNTVDANGPISDNGGTITCSGNGQFFDGEPIDLYVQENEGYRLSMLAHQKGSMTSFSLNEDDDMLYMITGGFTKVAKITLEAGNAEAAANIASHHTPGMTEQNLFVYDGGTSLTYYVPYGADRGSFYYDKILHDCVEIPSRYTMLYRGIGPRPIDAYSSEEEVDADMNSLSPTITEDGTYHILWARSAGACDVTIQPIAPGTKVTSRSEGDVTIQNPAPVAVCSGNYELKSQDGSDSAAVWLDDTYNHLNGTVGSDGCNVCFALHPKFGYYIDDPSKITVNGQSMIGNFSFGYFIVCYARVGAPGSAGSVFGGGAGTAAAAVGSAAVGLGAGFLLGKKKRKSEE